MSSLSPLETLKAEWHSTIHNTGGVCPVCQRWGKVYRRKLNTSMQEALEWLTSAQSPGNVFAYVDVPATAPKSVLRTNQLPSLRWWGLVESAGPGAPKRGLWRPTLAGWDFVNGDIDVYEVAVIVNGKVVSWEGSYISHKNVRKIKKQPAV